MKRNYFLFLLLFFVAFVCNAEPRSVRDWNVDLQVKFSEAYTYNETRSLFGMYCMEKCVFYISPKEITCVDGATSVVLINSKHFAKAVTGVCTKLGDKYIRIFNDFEVIMEAINDADNIGFAFAMQNGSFNVSRFGLKGSKIAITQALDNAIKNNANKNSNSDFRL
jgi:hypothetical protein